MEKEKKRQTRSIHWDWLHLPRVDSLGDCGFLLNSEDALAIILGIAFVIGTLLVCMLFSGCGNAESGAVKVDAPTKIESEISPPINLGFQPLPQAKVADKIDIGDEQAAGRDASKTQITNTGGISMTDVYLLIGIALFGQFLVRYLSGRLLNKNNANELARQGILERRNVNNGKLPPA